MISIQLEELMLIKKVNIDGSYSKYINVGKIDGNRSSGVPQLEIIGEEVFVAWTIYKDGKSQLKTVKLNSKLI